MTLPIKAGGLSGGAIAVTLAWTLAACAGAATRESGAGAAGAQRVVVKLVRASEDGTAIAEQATRVAGVPVRYAAATSASWHALALHCTSAAECDAAIARLRAAGAIYQVVEIEGRKARPAS
jgi:hypothetical protein